jgi:putative ABC transport system ATP-binding protein
MTIGPIILATGLGRDFSVGSGTVHAVRDVTLEVPRGEVVAIIGRSGSGKTTLLNMIGGLDRPTRGSVQLDGEDLGALSEQALVGVRRHRIGFVFQAFGLLPILTATENVEVPMRMLRAEPGARRERAAELLELVGLGERARHRPHELSGGEQQRVAIARALANRPELLIADEPTGHLDSQTGRTIMRLISSVARAERMTAIVATHDPALVLLADRVVELSDGRIVEPAAVAS